MPLTTFAASYAGSDGQRYSSAPNSSGVVMRAANGITLYLGRSCDAFSPQYGAGSWSWANGGFTVRFPRKTIGFGRQELFEMQNDGECRE